MAGNNNDDVTFLSYNPTGFGAEKVSWIKDLISVTKCSFLSIQEHFQTQYSGRKSFGNASKLFNDNFDDYKTFVTPAKIVTNYS